MVYLNLHSAGQGSKPGSYRSTGSSPIIHDVEELIEGAFDINHMVLERLHIPF